MENSLEKIQEDLKFQPPVVLTLEDTDVANGVMNGHTRMHLEPGNWPAALWCWCRCSEIVCFLLIDIDCFTGKVFGSGAVYKICGEKCGLILFPVAVIKKKKTTTWLLWQWVDLKRGSSSEEIQKSDLAGCFPNQGKVYMFKGYQGGFSFLLLEVLYWTVQVCTFSLSLLFPLTVSPSIIP